MRTTRRYAAFKPNCNLQQKAHTHSAQNSAHVQGDANAEARPQHRQQHLRQVTCRRGHGRIRAAPQVQLRDVNRVRPGAICCRVSATRPRRRQQQARQRRLPRIHLRLQVLTRRHTELLCIPTRCRPSHCTAVGTAEALATSCLWSEGDHKVTYGISMHAQVIPQRPPRDVSFLRLNAGAEAATLLRQRRAGEDQIV